MENPIYIVILLFIAYLTYSLIASKKRERYIEEYNFPKKVNEKIISTYPHLTEKDVEKVINALREYFLICRVAKLRMVSMPSQVVDVAWHEFILFTRGYHEFCKKGLGKFLHHTPAEAMQSQTIAQKGIKRAWRLSCKRENIHPKAAHKLPLLFSIDSELNIPDGFKYSLNCTNDDDRYCAAHIGCAGGSAGGCCGDGGGDGGGGSGCGGGS